ncbi:MAG: GTP-binding protein [Candidatus Lokiarchaeota archaeon]|nr:GTP-binding protein [Candidatus Lokiarchaeota archaeon]MBD3337492.1 GTP-binding protein [Candidatus Lokiarchaeota archaeon]
MSEDEEKIVFQSKTESIYKCIVIGDPAVGKTSLLTKFSTKQFKTQYIPTVGVNIVKEQIDIEFQEREVTVNLMLWDIAGQPQFYMLHKPYFQGADGMLLVFDITRSSTFSNVKNWYNTAVKYGLSGIPRILVGNKIDLKDERKIIQPMSKHLSTELNASYYETSAKTGENVKKIFEKLAEIIYHSKSQS